LESCPTRIFLPNERALEPQIAQVYQRFGLNDRQVELIAHATPKRDYYAQTARGNRLFALGLGPLALALAATSSPDDQRGIDRVLDAPTPHGFGAAFLRAKGLAWAADLIEAIPVTGTTKPVQDQASPIDLSPNVPPRPPPMSPAKRTIPPFDPLLATTAVAAVLPPIPASGVTNRTAFRPLHKTKRSRP
ncbi:MAG: hypothetical protein ABL904_00190, partial [Hyphomicrobiaceae bacterium]